jgi:glycosyltransferase involved in cell wall biosynthesis
MASNENGGNAMIGKHDNISTDKTAPRISVILAFLNGERFLAESIETVLKQDYADWELILIDDGSGETATAIARDYAERHPGKIRYLEHEGHANRGVTVSRNLGVAQARGELIALLDGDDIWEPNKLGEQVAIIDRHPEVGMVCGTVISWYSWDGGIDRLIPTGHARDRVLRPPEAALNLYPLGKANAPTPSDMLVRRDLLLEIGGFDARFTGPLQLYEDQVLLAKIYLAAPVYFASKAWLHYRQHQNSCVANVRRQGLYSNVRLHFLEWYRAYVAERPSTNAAVLRAVDRALWRERHVAVDTLLKIPGTFAFKVKRRIRSVFGLETPHW